jgi:hypothetical protein
MDFNTFYRSAHEAFDTVPEEFRDGVDGLTIRPEVLPHPILPGVFTLGQCITESYPSEWIGPETLRSVVALYHGSFHALASSDPKFDWEGELWATLTHELRHHLESLAGEDGLEGVDYAMEEAFRRAEGEGFDPLYYRAGVELAPGLYQVEYDFFLEQIWEPEAFESVEFVEFSWHGAPERVPRPHELKDIHYIWIEGLEVGPGSLQLVLLRKKRFGDRVRAWRRGQALEMRESGAVVDRS